MDVSTRDVSARISYHVDGAQGITEVPRVWQQSTDPVNQQNRNAAGILETDDDSLDLIDD